MTSVTDREFGAWEARLGALEDSVARIEQKVDRLLSFRAWVLGGASALAAAVSLAVDFLLRRV